MMRILHSLPRTHKLMLLPVATMVTVLGAHQIVSTLDKARYTPRQTAETETLLIPLEAETRPGVPSLATDQTPVSRAIQEASQAVATSQPATNDRSSSANVASSVYGSASRQINQDATQAHVPLSELTPSEVVDVADTTSAQARPGRSTPGKLTPQVDSSAALAVAQAEPAKPLPSIDANAHNIARILGTLNDRSSSSSPSMVVDATSYEDINEDELHLFDDGPVSLARQLDVDEPFVPQWQTYTVRSGDTFTELARAHFGMDTREVMNLLEEIPDKRLLTRWDVDDQFEYQLNEAGELATLRIMSNIRDGYLVERDASGTEVSTIERAGERTQRLYAGTVSGSFARSAQATGLTSAEVSELSRVLEKKLDFRRDTRRGDSFEVLVESDIIDGHSLDPRILAVNYDGSRMDLTLVRNPEDSQFYTPDGKGLNPSFNRYPFEGQYRVSSPFNLRRHHPVTGRISPHKGTDFAMPTGTPVDAPASGRVELVGHHPAAGRYIVVRHDNGYKTRYLHLSKPLVKRGDRVKMGDRIALSGNTGRSTGPHLHYEVLVNNKAVNAMNVELPKGGSLRGVDLAEFKRRAEPVLAALESGRTGTVVASVADREDDEDDSEG
ncbi:peptidoglycan DD-metalloendopeptidase family protein [Halomonas sp. 18H]|nr:peptidoglycan DD-metalloendopeptidase family protein [Halomonas sp. 18H]MCW4149287.1 peptidoglycan DD-metalloendopeptidase family protein [Halomonas sp. 18H]